MNRTSLHTLLLENRVCWDILPTSHPGWTFVYPQFYRMLVALESRPGANNGGATGARKFVVLSQLTGSFSVRCCARAVGIFCCGYIPQLIVGFARARWRARSPSLPWYVPVCSMYDGALKSDIALRAKSLSHTAVAIDLHCTHLFTPMTLTLDK